MPTTKANLLCAVGLGFNALLAHAFSELETFHAASCTPFVLMRGLLHAFVDTFHPVSHILHASLL